jgi:hypothetical protein
MTTILTNQGESQVMMDDLRRLSLSTLNQLSEEFTSEQDQMIIPMGQGRYEFVDRPFPFANSGGTEFRTKRGSDAAA